MNIFITLLELLKVKHTQSFSVRYFNEHPHKYNMYGLSKMLSDYGIDNVATRIPGKELPVSEIQTPFVAQFSNDFVAVYKVENNNVSFIWKGIKHVLPVENFTGAWTGIVLLAETSEKSIEPDFKQHKNSEFIDALKRAILISALGLLFIFAYIYNKSYTNLGISLQILICMTGIYISWLLLLKQMRIQSQYADKICSLFKQKDCNNVLESKAAKIFDVGWSEIGLAYFATTVLLLMLSHSFGFTSLSSNLLTSIACINILTLPFTLWSVWYQKKKANQWCVLCLIILALLWSIFIVSIVDGNVNIPYIISSPEAIQTFLLAGSCYIIVTLGINQIVPKLSAEKKIQQLQQFINSQKVDEDVFTTLLKKQPHYEMADYDSIIHFGNPESKLRLTVLSNPYCNPCANMHKRIEGLLQKVRNNISVQYILSSFFEAQNATNKYLIAACLENNTNEEVLKLFNEWFERGKPLKDDFFKDKNLNMENPAIEEEFARHEAWKSRTQLRSTPTVLVYGFQLPVSYKVEDLQYFTDLEL